MPDHPARNGVEDGAPERPDDQATQRIETGRRDADGPAPHEGWSRQPQESYDAGDSGGWGGPSPHHTGPLPRLRRPRTDHPSTDRTPDEDVTFAPAPGFEATGAGADIDSSGRRGSHAAHAAHVAPGDDDRAYGSHRHDASAPAAGGHGRDGDAPRDVGGPAAYGPPEPPRSGGAFAGEPRPGPSGWGRPAGGAGREDASPSGLGALFDLGFRRRSTAALAPVAYTVLLVFLLLDYMRSVYEYSSAAPVFGPAAFLGLLILFVVGAFKILVVAAVARLGLELCLDVADLARSRRGEGR